MSGQAYRTPPARRPRVDQAIAVAICVTLLAALTAAVHLAGPAVALAGTVAVGLGGLVVAGLIAQRSAAARTEDR